MLEPPAQLKKLPSQLDQNTDLKTLGETISENYLWYHLTRQQLLDLQDWINKQKNLKEENGS